MKVLMLQTVLSDSFNKSLLINAVLQYDWQMCEKCGLVFRWHLYLFIKVICTGVVGSISNLVMLI